MGVLGLVGEAIEENPKYFVQVGSNDLLADALGTLKTQAPFGQAEPPVTDSIKMPPLILRFAPSPNLGVVITLGDNSPEDTEMTTKILEALRDH